MLMLNDLIHNPDYKLHHTERRYGYYSVKNPGKAVRYIGIYGKGYRVFLPIHRKEKEDGIFIMYFIRRKENENV